MHDLQTIQFLNNAAQIERARVERESAAKASIDRANDLYDLILDGIYDTESVTVGDMRAATDALSALYDMAVKGGAK